MKTIFDELQQEVKNWWISLILGILYVIVAISLMFSPLSGYAVLSILFSVSMLFSGLLEISFAVSNRRRVSSWGWYLAGGIIDMILGFYLIAYPMLSMEVIPFIIAFWLMFRGFSSVGYAMDLKRYGTRDWGWYVAFGILAVICSLIILWQPGFGFGKTMEHNYELLSHLEEFRIFELPLLVGVSRKSMIYRLLDITPQEALNGTTVLDTICLLKGADILRVHDVKEAVETVRIVQAMRNNS